MEKRLREISHFFVAPRVSSSGLGLSATFSEYTVWHPLMRDVLFCFVFSKNFRLPTGLHSSYSISPTAGKKCQNYRADGVDGPQEMGRN